MCFFSFHSCFIFSHFFLINGLLWRIIQKIMHCNCCRIAKYFFLLLFYRYPFLVDAKNICQAKMCFCSSLSLSFSFPIFPHSALERVMINDYYNYGLNPKSVVFFSPFFFITRSQENLKKKITVCYKRRNFYKCC